jgi:alpha(1,3/1,4) fucosyltransferase
VTASNQGVPASPSRVGVFLDPITFHFEQDELFEQHPYGDFHAPFLHAKQVLELRGFSVHTADLLLSGAREHEINCYFALGNIRNYERVAKRGDTILSGLFHFEAPIVHPTTYRKTPEASRFFRRIYSFSTAEALAPFGCGGVELRKFMIPEPYDGIAEDGFERLWDRGGRKFLCMISQNKLPNLWYRELYTERLRLLEYFSRSDSIDLYGIGWDKMPFRVGERRLPPQAVRVQRAVWERLPFVRKHPFEEVIRKVWRGTVDSKHETMSGYTFAITYENMELDGWINEKIFDAFLAGTVPIFRGAPDVTDYIPPECFIDARDFATHAELESYLRSLGEQEIQAYRENARAFMASAGYAPFTKQAFAEILLSAVEEDLASAA